MKPAKELSFVNRTMLFLTLLALSAGRGAADDGSWVTQRGYVPAEGALYSEAGNPDIVMEKEYLELRDVGLGTTRAVFQFRNTTAAAVIAECAFPILFDFVTRPITLDGKGSWPRTPRAPECPRRGTSATLCPAGTPFVSKGRSRTKDSSVTCFLHLQFLLNPGTRPAH